jgi:hypothetical protein
MDATITLFAKVANIVSSTEQDGTMRIDCDLKIGDYQLVQAIALKRVAALIDREKKPFWAQVRGFVFHPGTLRTGRAGFDPLPIDPFCILGFEVLAGEPGAEELSILIQDGKGIWRTVAAEQNQQPEFNFGTAV